MHTTEAPRPLARVTRRRQFTPVLPGDAFHGLNHLPAIDRERAELALLDIIKWFGETSGGVKTYLTQKTAYVRARPQLRHTLVIPGARDEVTVDNGTRIYRLRGPRIPTQQAYRFLLATRSTRRLIAHERPHIIEVGSPFMVPWVARHASREWRVPMVLFHHSTLRGAVQSLGSPQGDAIGTRWNAATNWYLRRLASLFRAVIVASDYAASELREAGVEKVVRIPLGVDLDLFHPGRRAERAWTIRRMGLSDSAPVVLYIGRLAHEKHLQVVLDGWREVEHSTGAQLVIVGDGAQAASLRAACRSARVRWIPYLDDRALIASLHAAADVYVSPGEVETFGLSALEALASGTPVLSVASGGVAELVQRSGAGALYAHRSPDDFASNCIALLGSRRHALGLRGRAWAEQEHDWTLVFDRLFTLYREIVHS